MKIKKPLVKRSQEVVSFRITKEQRQLINETAQLGKTKTLPDFFQKAIVSLSLQTLKIIN